MRLRNDMRIFQGGHNETDITFDRLCIQLLRLRQKELCACGVLLTQGYQLTHKRYAPDISLNDLELKCGPCHALEHGYKANTGTLRLS